METARHSAQRSVDAVMHLAAVAPPTNAETALGATATFLLSEEGRKASLLAGGNGRAVQDVSVRVPPNRLHLVSVDKLGVARLKLRPRFELDAENTVIRIESAPTYDVPPSLDDLFRAAARNYELERAYVAERSATRARKRDAEQEYRQQIAATFLADQTQRGRVHPPPTPNRCCIVTERGRVFFDIATDRDAAQKVPPEAHRRFRLDLRAKRERVRQERATQVAIHEEKKQFVAQWVPVHGTSEQQARHVAGVLPMDEAIETMADQAFACLGGRPRYGYDGAARLQTHLRGIPEYRDALVSRSHLIVNSHHADRATREQWAFLQELRNAKPDASVVLRVHTLSWKHDESAPALVLYGALVTCKTGPFTLRREYAVPDASGSS